MHKKRFTLILNLTPNTGSQAWTVYHLVEATISFIIKKDKHYLTAPPVLTFVCLLDYTLTCSLVTSNLKPAIWENWHKVYEEKTLQNLPFSGGGDALDNGLLTLEADSLNVCFDDPNEVLVHLGVSDLLVLGVA